MLLLFDYIVKIQIYQVQRKKAAPKGDLWDLSIEFFNHLQ